MSNPRFGTRLLALAAAAAMGALLSACAAAPIVGFYQGSLNDTTFNSQDVANVQANVSVGTSTTVSGQTIWTLSGSFSANDALHGAVSGSISGAYNQDTGDASLSLTVTTGGSHTYTLGGTLSGNTISGAWGVNDGSGRGGGFSITK